MYAAARKLLFASTLCCVFVSAARGDEADDQFAVAAGHYSAKRWELAVDEFRTFLREYPEHAKRGKAQFFQAEALVQIGKYAEAYPLFVDVHMEHPRGGYAKQALFRAAEAAFMSGRGNEAQLRMSQFRSKHPNDPLNAHLLGYQANLAIRTNDPATAERSYRESLERFGDLPTADECRYALAQLLERQKKSAEAEELWRELAQRDRSPLSEIALLQLSTKEAEKKNFHASLDLCDSLEKRFPKSAYLPQAQLSRGRALYELGRYADARQTLSPLVSDKKLAQDARYWLALTQKAEKQFHAATETLNSALEASQKKVDVTVTVKENTAEAKTKSAPVENSANPSRARGEAKEPTVSSKPLPNQRGPEVGHASEDGRSSEEGHGPEATAQTEHAPTEQQRRRAAAIRYQAGDSLIRAGDFRKAIDTLQGGDNDDDPTSLSTRYLLAIALQGEKRHDEALQTLRELDAVIARKLSDPDPKALTELRGHVQLALATSLIADEKFAEAIKPLQAHLDSGRQDVGAERARSALVICLARTDRLDAAKTMLDELKTHHPKSKTLLTATHHVAEAAYAAEQYEMAYALFSRLAAEGNPSEMIATGLAGMGWSRMQHGEAGIAEEIFGEFLRLFPNDSRAADVALARGQALEQLGRKEAALQVYQHAIGRYPQSPQRPQILIAAARMNDRLGHDEQSALLYQRFVREYPQSDEIDAALYGWAWALRDLGRGAESDKIFRQLHQQYPKSRFWADASFRLAERASQHGDRKQAEDLLQPLFDGDCPPDVLQHALYLAAQMATEEERWSDVEPPLRRLIEEFPDSTLRLPAEFWCAEAAYRQGNATAAKDRFDALSQRLDGQTARWAVIVPLRRAQLRVQDKQWKQAREMAESIERDYPDFDRQYEADYLIGRCLAAEADFDAARAAYQRVIRSPSGGKTETAAMAQWMIGESHFHQENYETALREYLRVEILYPYPRWQAAALLQAGKCEEELGHAKQATELYARLVKKHPDSEFAAEAAKHLKNETD